MGQQTLQKNSKQRTAILNFLKDRKDHPTADYIYQEIRNQIPNISLGTVYRNLSLLAENGQILRLSCNDKSDHFDANIEPHYHFICHSCGCVKDFPLPYKDDINKIANDHFSGVITDHTIIFEGYCDTCSK